MNICEITTFSDSDFYNSDLFFCFLISYFILVKQVVALSGLGDRERKIESET